MKRDNERRQIGYEIIIVERGRSHIENIFIRGNEKTKDHVILREFDIETGDIFSNSKVLSGMRNLYNLQYFSAIQPDVVQGSDPSLVNLILDVEEQNTASVQFGVTFSGITDANSFPVSVFASWAETNFMGYGQSLSSSLTLSPTQQSLSLSFGESWLAGKPISLAVSLAVHHSVLYAGQDTTGKIFSDSDWDNAEDNNIPPDPYDTWDEYETAGTIPDSYLMQHNMVAVQDKKTMLAYGDEAYAMFEKAPANIQVSSPMSYGNLASISYMQAFLKSLLEKNTKGQLRGSEFFVALPTDMQERSFTMLIQDSNMKPKAVYLIDKPVAAGLGLDINVKEAQGVMVIDIGAETTEISVLSLGGTVISRLIQTGGRSIDDAIQAAIRKEYNFYIGNKTAENIKKELAYAVEPEEGSMQICGRNMVIGLPQMLEITTAFVYEAIKEQLNVIMDAVKSILERTPPELGVDIIRNGIYLTGGSARIRKLDQLIQERSGIRVTVDNEPELSVAKGLARVINDKEFRSLAFVTKEQKYE